MKKQLLRNHGTQSRCLRQLIQLLQGIICCLCLLAASAGASDDKPRSGDIEFGYVDTAGNTETTTIKSRVDVDWIFGRWKNNTHFDSLNTVEDNDRSAEKYYISNKLDRNLSEDSYVFGFLSYEEDHFSGFDYQATASAGYGRTLLKHIDNMSLDIEVGPGYRTSKVEDNSVAQTQSSDGVDDQDELIARLYGDYEWEIGDSGAVFGQSLAVGAGSENTIIRSSTSLKTKVMRQFALKLSYDIKYTEEVPAGTETTDKETVVTLVYSF